MKSSSDSLAPGPVGTSMWEKGPSGLPGPEAMGSGLEGGSEEAVLWLGWWRGVGGELVEDII